MRLENFRIALWGLLIVMTVLLTVFTYSSNYYSNLVLDETVKVEQLRNNLLELRRAEKDFIQRYEQGSINSERHLKLHEKYSNSILTVLNNQNSSEQLLIQFNRYIESFVKRVEYAYIIGNDKKGLISELFRYDLSEDIKYEKDLKLSLLKFIISPKKDNYKLVKRQYTRVINQEKLINLKSKVDLYYYTKQNIGLTETQGIRAEMRASVHQFEKNLKSLTEDLTQNINDNRNTLFKLQLSFLSGIFILFMILYRKMFKDIMKALNSISSKFKNVNFKSIKTEDFSTPKPENKHILQELEYGYDKSIIALNHSFNEALELKKSQEEMKVNLDFKSSFLAKMAHELRTPLNGVIGMIEILKTSKNLSKTDNLLVSDLSESSENLLQIINSTLDYSKLEAGKLELKTEPYDLKKLISQVKTTHFKVADNKGLSFDSFAPISQHLFLDKIRLAQILNNLVSNAIKFTEKGGLTLEAAIQNETKDTSVIRFSIKDTGKGISKNQIDNLFNAYSQLKEDVNKTNSTGLGLSVCKELVELMGGKIVVNSELGLGTEFSFDLEFKKAKTQDQKDNKELFIDENRIKDTSILVVDDIEMNRKVAHLMLQKIGLKNIDFAENGLEALNMVKINSYDLILMDINMPVMDGAQATQKIKSEIKSPPVIVGLSAEAMEGDKEKYIEIGMSDYLIKPIKLENLKNLFLNHNYFSKTKEIV